MPLDTLLSRHARYRPQHTALVFEDERLTFAELDRRVSRIANALPGSASRRATRSRPCSRTASR